MNCEIEFDAYSKFYRLLIDYIPSLRGSSEKYTDIIMNVDLIMQEAKNNSFNYESGVISESGDFEFDAINYDDEEIIDLMFRSFSDVGDIAMMQNANPCEPIECDFCNLKKEISQLPMSIFAGGDVVIIWKRKKIISVFHHTGYYAHIFM